jgi:hypothetical protein
LNTTPASLGARIALARRMNVWYCTVHVISIEDLFHVIVSLNAETPGRRLARPLPSFSRLFLLLKNSSCASKVRYLQFCGSFSLTAGTNVQRRTLDHHPAAHPRTRPGPARLPSRRYECRERVLGFAVEYIPVDNGL